MDLDAQSDMEDEVEDPYLDINPGPEYPDKLFLSMNKDDADFCFDLKGIN